MNPDRDLLEAAAAAACYDVRWHESWACYVHRRPFYITQPPTVGGQRDVWVPFYDDGDALRLAVRCGLAVSFFVDDRDWRDGRVRVGYSTVVDPRMRYVFEDRSGDIFTATRRAIVRAAAAMAVGGASVANNRIAPVQTGQSEMLPGNSG